MKQELMPYYISRAVLSLLVGLLLASGQALWIGLLMSIIMFAGFIWYAHSGRYIIDSSQPLTPLRRDAHGTAIRNQALVIAVAVGGVAYAILSLLAALLPVMPAGMGAWAVVLGVITYFVVSNVLYFRDVR